MDPQDATKAIQALRDDFEKFKLDTVQQQARVNYSISFRDLQDFIEVVATAPTHIPSNAYEQVKLYVNGATLRLYICDNTVNPVVWHYVTMSA